MSKTRNPLVFQGLWVFCFALCPLFGHCLVMFVAAAQYGIPWSRTDQAAWLVVVRWAVCRMVSPFFRPYISRMVTTSFLPLRRGTL